MTLPTRTLTVTINGKPYGPLKVPEGMMMIDVLHEMLGLTGSRLGCGQGICHACTVIWDREDGGSEEVPVCITGAGFFDGKRIRTIEGIASRNDKGEILALSPVQRAFLDHFSFQCGYCTPGFILMTRQLLDENPDPDDDAIKHYLSGNLCRCGAYLEIMEAVKLAARKRKGTE